MRSQIWKFTCRWGRPTVQTRDLVVCWSEAIYSMEPFLFLLLFLSSVSNPIAAHVPHNKPQDCMDELHHLIRTTVPMDWIATLSHTPDRRIDSICKVNGNPNWHNDKGNKGLMNRRGTFGLPPIGNDNNDNTAYRKKQSGVGSSMRKRVLIWHVLSTINSSLVQSEWLQTKGVLRGLRRKKGNWAFLRPKLWRLWAIPPTGHHVPKEERFRQGLRYYWGCSTWCGNVHWMWRLIWQWENPMSKLWWGWSNQEPLYWCPHLIAELGKKKTEQRVHHSMSHKRSSDAYMKVRAG